MEPGGRGGQIKQICKQNLLQLVRPTWFFELSLNLDPIFQFNRVGLDAQGQKTCWIG